MSNLNTTNYRSLFAALIGNVIEFYDFMIYAFCAVYISKNFFEIYNPELALTFTYCIQGLGYLSRPLGALIFGHIGDRYGRQSALVYSIVISGISTFFIGILPANGSLLPVILLILLRIIQGMSVSGEEGGAATYLSEIFSKDKKSLIGALILSSVFCGVLLGGLVVFILKLNLSYKYMQSFGWRIPFFLSLPLCFVAYFLRKGSIESQDFNRIKLNEKILMFPSYELFKKNKLKIFCLVLIVASFASITCFYTVLYPAILSNKFEPNSGSGLLFVILGLLFVIIITPLYSLYVDKVGYYKSMTLSLLLSAILLSISVKFINSNELYLMIIHNFCLVTSVSLISAPIFPILVSSFDTQIRCSGVSFVFNFTVAFISGVFPALSTYMSKGSFNNEVGVYIVLFFIFISILGIKILNFNNTSLGK